MRRAEIRRCSRSACQKVIQMRCPPMARDHCSGGRTHSASLGPSNAPRGEGVLRYGTCHTPRECAPTPGRRAITSGPAAVQSCMAKEADRSDLTGRTAAIWITCLSRANRTRDPETYKMFVFTNGGAHLFRNVVSETREYLARDRPATRGVQPSDIRRESPAGSMMYTGG